MFTPASSRGAGRNRVLPISVKRGQAWERRSSDRHRGPTGRELRSARGPDGRDAVHRAFTPPRTHVPSKGFCSPGGPQARSLHRLTPIETQRRVHERWQRRGQVLQETASRDAEAHRLPRDWYVAAPDGGRPSRRVGQVLEWRTGEPQTRLKRTRFRPPPADSAAQRSPFPCGRRHPHQWRCAIRRAPRGGAGVNTGVPRLVAPSADRWSR